MNHKKIELIINSTDKKLYSELIQSLSQVIVPEGFVLEVQRVAVGGGIGFMARLIWQCGRTTPNIKFISMITSP